MRQLFAHTGPRDGHGSITRKCTTPLFADSECFEPGVGHGRGGDGAVGRDEVRECGGEYEVHACAESVTASSSNTKGQGLLSSGKGKGDGDTHGMDAIIGAIHATAA